jgi:glycosyltransferase involved in cell wall biosynthesis
VCYANLYDDQTAADLPPASYLDRRALLRHLPREMVSRGHEAIVVHQFSRRHTLVEERVRHELVPSPRWMRAAAAIVGRVLGREAAHLEPAVPAVRAIRDWRPDVVHFFGSILTLNLAVLELGLGRNRPPVVVGHHGGWPAASRLLRRAQRATLARASRLLFTTRDHARPFVEAGVLEPDGLRVVEVMEVSTAFRMTDREAARAVTGMSGDPVFVWAGRLEQIKDPLTALKGFDRIRAAWNGAQLYLYYLTDLLLPELRAFVNSRPGLASHVHFRGRAPHRDMEAVFNSADLLLQASRSVVPGRVVEYSGFVPLEAMACGVVPVLTDLPSFRAMTANGRFGVLFEAGDDAGLARRVLALDRRSIAAMGAEIRAHFEENLSFRALASRLEGVYRDALDTPGGSVTEDPSR